MNTRLLTTTCLALAGLLLAAPAMVLGQATVRGQAQLVSRTKGRKTRDDNSNVVVWLVPESRPVSRAELMREFKPTQPLRLVQKDKGFRPHILIVPAGAVVEFPNRDPFFHNVFSLFDGKRFDLGLYEAGSTRRVHFDRPGISYIFCNIHAQMSGVVIALGTPYYAISERSGTFTIPAVPPGNYEMQVWYEGSTPDVLKALTRKINIPESGVSLAAIHVLENTSLLPHKNKYGQDYDPSTYDPLYQQQQNE
ncbi:MAG TPA: carboxypeptidase regulatory-like domain-containing protein [Terriglobales bacterium]|nr:carboxypeptidase regulatory-like domain-containing protein [Terriglobales bacterium]